VPYLTAYFGGAVPGTITVNYASGPGDYFDSRRNGITISMAETHGPRELGLVAHEASHLALAAFSGGVSTLEPFRFMDEGLAAIIEHTVGGTLPKYRHAALVVAARRLSTGSVSLADLQAWSRYFGDPIGHPERAADYDAYEVGSAFDFFVQDTHGEGALRSLFADLARTRSLASSVRTVFGHTLDETEAAWVAYLRAVDVSVASRPPAVVEMVPANGAAGVATDLAEVRVTFDTDMTPFICVNTPCNEGICYDHAVWRDLRTLAIKIDRPLMPDHPYSLSLGSPPRCMLKSEDRVELPVVKWEFRTR
jgi:hypothetical protein